MLFLVRCNDLLWVRSYFGKKVGGGVQGVKVGRSWVLRRVRSNESREKPKNIAFLNWIILFTSKTKGWNHSTCPACIAWIKMSHYAGLMWSLGYTLEGERSRKISFLDRKYTRHHLTTLYKLWGSWEANGWLNERYLDWWHSRIHQTLSLSHSTWESDLELGTSGLWLVIS